jgi:hypothetical protein
VNTKREKHNARVTKKKNRDELISSFIDEIDSGKICTFEEEDSFNVYLETIKSKAEQFISPKVSGKDHIDFQIFFPQELFCAYLSQCKFDRESDIKYRYFSKFALLLLTLIHSLGVTMLNISQSKYCYQIEMILRLYSGKMQLKTK